MVAKAVVAHRLPPVDPGLLSGGYLIQLDGCEVRQRLVVRVVVFGHCGERVMGLEKVWAVLDGLLETTASRGPIAHVDVRGSEIFPAGCEIRLLGEGGFVARDRIGIPLEHPKSVSLVVCEAVRCKEASKPRIIPETDRGLQPAHVRRRAAHREVHLGHVQNVHNRRDGWELQFDLRRELVNLLVLVALVETCEVIKRDRGSVAEG